VNYYDDIVHVLRNTKKRQKQTVKQLLNSHDKVHFAYGKHTMSTAAK